MKLTQRQEVFIGKLIELYIDYQSPIHYSAVAERLGVSDITAYDMLRLLEKKGLIVSQYELADDKSGPGRSKIVFAPSPKAHQMMADLIDEIEPDFPGVKTQIIENIRLGNLEEPELTQEILESLPSEEDSIRFCTDLITALASHIQHTTGKEAYLAQFSKILSSENAASRLNLGLMGGFASGVLMNEGVMDADALLDNVHRYHSCIANMDPDQRSLLANSLLHMLERFNTVQMDN